MTLGKQYRYQPPQTLLVHQPLLISIVYFNTLPMVTLIKRGANKSHSKYYPLIVQFPFVRLVKGCKHRPGQTLLTSLSSGSRRSLWRRVATPCQHLSCRLCSQHYTRDCAKTSGALSSRARVCVCVRTRAGKGGWVSRQLTRKQGNTCLLSAVPTILRGACATHVRVPPHTPPPHLAHYAPPPPSINRVPELF